MINILDIIQSSKYIIWWSVLIIPFGTGIVLYYLKVLTELNKERNN